MSDKAQNKPEAKPKDKAAAAGSEVVKSQAAAPKRERTTWTLERCKQYARRFTSEALWASGAEASYKSAVAHGWLAECLQEMEKSHRPPAGGKVIPGAFGKKGGDGAAAGAGKKAA